MSRIGTTLGIVCAFVFVGWISATAQQSSVKASRVDANPKIIFESGERALRAGNLEQAERAFRRVLEIDPKDAGAYSNLGVIYMRRKQWPQALTMFKKADRVAPDVPGIQLNIGLAYYRQNDYRSALAPFESVLRKTPSAAQPRYLLGLCYFLTERWQDAATTLEPLWPDQNHNLSYLYVLGIAAGKGGRHDLEERALSRLVEVGQDTPEFHLFMGKAHLNREEYDDAIRELEAAVKANPKLPFVRFNLGLAYLHKQNYEQAKTEFLADVAVDPDTAATYDQLGDVYVLLQEDVLAEKSYLAALKLDKGMQNSRLGLAKIYDREHRYRDALAQLDAAATLDPQNYSVRYLRGQILVRSGQRVQGQEELAAATKIMNTQRTKRQHELEGGPLPHPELTATPE